MQRELNSQEECDALIVGFLAWQPMGLHSKNIFEFGACAAGEVG